MVERETFYGDRSQRFTIKIIWLRISFEVRLGLPWRQRWRPW
ncbi:MAG TPA: hypothetical protein VF516_00275 [Kofleriaceae bacterium]